VQGAPSIVSDSPAGEVANVRVTVAAKFAFTVVGPVIVRF
jgi:hypothetical protein